MSLSALRREMLPLASPLASASKECSLASLVMLLPPFPIWRSSSSPPCYATWPSMQGYNGWRNFREFLF